MFRVRGLTYDELQACVAARQGGIDAAVELLGKLAREGGYSQAADAVASAMAAAPAKNPAAKYNLEVARRGMVSPLLTIDQLFRLGVIAPLTVQLLADAVLDLSGRTPEVKKNSPAS